MKNEDRPDETGARVLAQALIVEFLLSKMMIDAGRPADVAKLIEGLADNIEKGELPDYAAVIISDTVIATREHLSEIAQRAAARAQGVLASRR